MHQISSNSSSRPLAGALFMIGAGLSFAASNLITPTLTFQMGVPSTAVVFWQYLLASVLALPLLFKIGVSALKTAQPLLHEIRALASALGVQVFAFGFASGVPLWQMVALTMTAPFFIVAGAVLFLGERLTGPRLLAIALGFAGALMVSGVGGEGFTLAALLPVGAAALWGAASVLTRYLAREETPEALTLFMLVLITPNHVLIGLAVGLLAALGLVPAALAGGFDFALPGGAALGLIGALAALTALAQYCLSRAYQAAEATFLQPFDDLKLPLNTLLGWLVLSQAPAAWFWPGAALIVSASLFLLNFEARRPGTAPDGPISQRDEP